jgi:hypothetical protein
MRIHWLGVTVDWEKSGREGKATFASRRWSVLLEVWCIMVSFAFSPEEFANSLFFILWEDLLSF